MSSIYLLIDEELKYAQEVSKKKKLEQNEFWKGRIYTLKRLKRIIKEEQK